MSNMQNQSTYATPSVVSVKATDNITLRVLEDALPTNVHSAMKQPTRRIFGKVAITYTDPILTAEDYAEASSVAYNSNLGQLTDTITSTDRHYFTLYDNDLSGNYPVSDAYSQVGWTSGVISDAQGVFAEPPYVKLNFSARPIFSISVAFDKLRNNIARDFVVTAIDENSNAFSYSFVDNTEEIVEVSLAAPLANIVSLKVEVSKVSKPNSPAVILDIPLSSTVLYKGYEDVSELISIDMLEELTYEDEIEALGGVSANEVTVALDNSSRDFFFNSGSAIASQLRRNRKIVPWLGVEIRPGSIEWYTLGTYWAYKWDVPTEGLTAKVVGFDTIGLLDQTDYTEHQVQINKSIGELTEYVLNDAKRKLRFIEYDIDPALYDIVIPYAWFDRGSHAAALRKISLCYPMHIYCDRHGRICAKPQKLKVDWHYDEWSDDTNVVSKDYSSLYTTLPNIVNVTVSTPKLVYNTELARDEQVIYVSGKHSVVLTFSDAFVSDFVLNAVYDPSLVCTYEVFSWGVRVNFEGTGTVSGIACYGTAVSLEDKSIMTRTNDESVRVDGAVTRDITSDFIQTTTIATDILDRIFSLSEHDKYDATVKYRGDIALTINDPILLHNGIAPDNRYNIKRHQLTWDGSLTGSAELNT